MKTKYLAVAAVMSMMAGSVFAAPSVAKVGECTTFLSNNSVSSKSTCSVNMDYDSQTKTTTLKTATDTHTIIATHGGKDSANPTFSLDGLVAKHYLRDASNNKPITLSQAEANDTNVLTCYKTEKDNICHS